jgi:TIR domain/Pentapeptide repeats (8 copies)
MANQEQRDLLRRGLGIWNTWRQQQIEFQPDLSGADLHFAHLSGVDLSGAILSRATLSGAIVDRTIFGGLDLRTVNGLETLQHMGPSTIGTNTIERSHGELPEVFLRGAGLSDTFIAYARSLAQRPIEYYTCFLSYSSKDQDFAERLYADLQSGGVRCWFAPEDMKTGDRIRQRIEESIRLYDKLLLVLSQHSITSSWVEFEMEAALAKENSRNTLVLFPIRLDNAVMESETSWAAHIRRMRHITSPARMRLHRLRASNR